MPGLIQSARRGLGELIADVLSVVKNRLQYPARVFVARPLIKVSQKSGKYIVFYLVICDSVEL